MNKKITNKHLSLIQTAEDLFLRFGMKRVTVEEICKTANVSKVTFYKYYKNKNDLIKYIWNKMLDDGYADLNRINAMDIPFPKKIKLLLQLKKEYTSKMSREYIDEYLHASPELQPFFQQLIQNSLQLFVEFIKNAQKTGDVRPEMKPEFFIAVINKLFELANDEKLINLYPDYTDFALEINNFIYYGILPREDCIK